MTSGSALQNVSISHSRAAFGGALAIRWNCMAKDTITTRKVNISHSYASVAGGAMFIASAGAALEMTEAVCGTSENASVHLENVTAARYGNSCATSPRFLGRQGAPPTAFVAPGIKVSVILDLYDLLWQRVVGIDSVVEVSLDSASVPAPVLLSGEPRDLVLPSTESHYTFDHLRVVSEPGANGTFHFTANTNGMCSGLPYRIPFRVMGCLPSSFAASTSVLQCSKCPTGTYLLPASGKTSCIPCSTDDNSHHAGDCLHRENETLGYGTWKIAEGFYPLPSFDAPEELVPCPNEACHGSSCEVRFSGGLFFALSYRRCTCRFMSTLSVGGD